jgi:hypothetical protein
MTLAALNDSNIAAIQGLEYSDGVDFLIMNLVSGGPRPSSKRKDFV